MGGVADLTDYGAVVTPQAAVHRGPRDAGADVWLGQKHVGWFAQDQARDYKCFVTERDPDAHGYDFAAADDPDHDRGYGLSLTLVQRFERIDLERVYVLEPDDVIEYTLAQFADGSDDSYYYQWEDPQRIVPVERSLNVWESHTTDFWLDAPDDWTEA